MRFLSLLALASLLVAQATPHFEVATIKPADPKNRPGGAPPPANGVAYNTISLSQLIGLAYRNELGANPTIEGGPDWVVKDRFDVVAIATERPTAATSGPMLRELLAERFGLKVHIETREQNVFALVPARSDGKLGPKVKPWNGMCFNNPPPPPSTPRNARCFAAFRIGAQVAGGSMAAVADLLSSPITGLGRPVVDRTGIPGEFDMDLEFDFNASDPRSGRVYDGPALTTVLQEQWGLKLEPAKAPVPILIIDAATPPTEN